MRPIRKARPMAGKDACLDSLEVSGKRPRNVFAACAAVILCLAVTGCQEDRSNLLPRESTERIESEIARIETQVVEGLCFEALRAAQNIEEELGDLSRSIDPALLRTLRDGVTQLQISIQDECVEADAREVQPEVVEEIEEVTPPSGGTTLPPEEGGGQAQRPEPAPDPAPNPQPAPGPTPPDNSGGVSPSASGGQSGA